jgi:hypothetical protein
LNKSNADIKLPLMNQSDYILELARHRCVLRAADVREHGWSPQLLIRLHKAGKLQRFARGLYGLPDAEVTEHQTLIEISKRVPKAVLCLLSALQFHEIGTQLPHEVWIALPEATQTPALSYRRCASRAHARPPSVQRRYPDGGRPRRTHPRVQRSQDGDRLLSSSATRLDWMWRWRR